MFRLIEDVVSNVVDVGIGVMTFGEYGDFSKRSVSKMAADGIELYLIADFYGTTLEAVQDIIGDS